MSQPDAFEALADSTRRAILELLLERESLTAGEIAARFPSISRPAVSRHLRLLREAGLVIAWTVGREWHYRLEPDGFRDAFVAWLERFAPIWESSLATLKARVEGKEDES